MNQHPFSYRPLLRGAIIALFLTAGSLHAATESPEVERWVEIALQENPELQAVRGVTDATRYRIATARTLSDPTLQYREFLQSDMRRRAVEMMQDFPWPGTLSESGRAARHQARAALYQFRDRELDLTLRVREGYAQYALLDATLRHLDEDLKLLAALEQSIEAAVSAGRDRSGALLRVETDRVRIEDRIERLRSERETEGHALRTLLGLAPDQDLPGTPSLNELPENPNTRAAEPSGEQPLIRAASETAAARKATVRAVRAADRPGIRLGAG